jgi:RNA polymerase sigma-70 factor, ECF subfamily
MPQPPNRFPASQDLGHGNRLHVGHISVTPASPIRLTSWGQRKEPNGSMTQVDPEDIAQRAVQRDPNAFAQIYDQHADTVYRSIFYRVGDAGVAEDLTAEVFVKAWERIDRFQWRNVPVQHWLLRIAKNMVIDHYRSRRRLSSPIDELGDAPSTDPSPEDHVARDIEIEALGRALGLLADEQRDVLLLRFVEGYSHRDVAAVLGKSVVAVRQIQVRGLRTLQNLLTENETGKRVGASATDIRAYARGKQASGQQAASGRDGRR